MKVVLLLFVLSMIAIVIVAENPSFHVSVQVKAHDRDQNSYEHVAGGNIIDLKLILTVGAIFTGQYDQNSYIIVAGTRLIINNDGKVDGFSFDSSKKEKEGKFAEKLRHNRVPAAAEDAPIPQIQDVNTEKVHFIQQETNNIAIIELEKPLEDTQNIRTVTVILQENHFKTDYLAEINEAIQVVAWITDMQLTSRLAKFTKCPDNIGAIGAVCISISVVDVDSMMYGVGAALARNDELLAIGSGNTVPHPDIDYEKIMVFYRLDTQQRVDFITEFLQKN